MLERRYIKLKELIEAGTWDIDLSTGIVVGKFGSIGATGKGGYLRMVSHGAIYIYGAGNCGCGRRTKSCQCYNRPYKQ